jgi:hypothetical protein
MQNEAKCKNCDHSLESHPPDFGTKKISKCKECDCMGFIYS